MMVVLIYAVPEDEPATFWWAAGVTTAGAGILGLVLMTARGLRDWGTGVLMGVGLGIFVSAVAFITLLGSLASQMT